MSPEGKYFVVYCIVIALAYIYFFHIEPNHGDIISKAPSVDILGDAKCIVNYKGCEHEKIDGWIGVRMLIFSIIGMAFPGKHLFVFNRSALAEFLKLSMRYPARPVINPLVSLIGYWVGSSLVDQNVPSAI